MFSSRNKENIAPFWLEKAPYQKLCNEYQQHMFSWRNKKNINTFGLKKKQKKNTLSRAMSIVTQLPRNDLSVAG